jgi:hypothetical protein
MAEVVNLSDRRERERMFAHLPPGAMLLNVDTVMEFAAGAQDLNLYRGAHETYAVMVPDPEAKAGRSPFKVVGLKCLAHPTKEPETR